MGRSFPLRWTRPVASSNALLRDPLLLSVCFAIATLPIEISGLWLPTSLINLSRIGMLAAIAIVARRALLESSRLLLPPRPIVIGAGAVLVVELLSAFTTRWPNAVRELGGLLFYAAFAFAVLQAVRDRAALVTAGRSFMAAAVFEAGVMFAQQIGDFYLTEIRSFDGHRNGTFVEPNIAARFLALAIVGGLAAVRLAGRRASQAFVVLVPIAGAMVLTFSRTGWLLLVFVAIAWVVLGYRDRRAWLGSAIVIATFAAGLLIVPNALTRATDVPAAASAALSDGPRLASLLAEPPVSLPAPPTAPTYTPLDPLLNALPLDIIRRYLARAGIAMFLDHPLTGVGLGGFQPQLLGPYFYYIDPEYRPAPITLAHTDVIRIAAEEGLVGLGALVFFLAGIVTTLRGALRGADGFQRVAVSATGLGLLVVFLAAQTEGRFFNDPYVWLLVGTLAALAAMARQAQPGEGADIIPRNPSSP
jgi:putative inorganic carbon (HCO3(-)) transporter